MFTLEQLRAFMAVADELHYGRAAERLRMTQPPLTRSIQKLERAVGVRLLDRDNRKVELTAAGAAFLTETRRILAMADRASTQARRIQDGAVGTVRLGFTATSAFGILTGLLDYCRESFPTIHLELAELVTTSQVAMLLAEELDLGLARPTFDTDAVGSLLLHRENLLLAVPDTHPFADRREVPPTAVANEPLVMYDPDRARYFHDLVHRLVPVTPNQVVHSVTQVMTMLWLVAGGHGMACVPESAARISVPGVRFVGLTGLPDRPVQLHLLWNAGSRNPALRSLLDGLHSTYG